MPLDPRVKASVESEARRRGIDPVAAVREAERLASEPAPTPDSPTRPIADRLLIGFLPFIKVVELRSIWLGLPDRIPDDELTCSDYQVKHGGAFPAAESSPSPAA